MNNHPEGAQYVYNGSYYRTGSNRYAMYWVKHSWRESALVTNAMIREHGEAL